MSNLNELPQPGATCLPAGVTDQHGQSAFTLRFGTATADAVKTGSVTHPVNTDLAKFTDGLGSYTKALLQASPGIVDPATFKAFLQACGIAGGGTVGDFSNPAIMRGGTAKLNGPRAALAWQQSGKDSQGYGAPLVPPAPALDSMAYAIELVELYWAALLRDVPFESYPTNALAQAAAKELSDLAAANPGQYAGPVDAQGKVTPELLFRGGFGAKPAYFAGETVGPYLSQFCLIPTALGRLPITQQIMTYLPGQDFMITEQEWFNIQNGKAPTSVAAFDPVLRYMRCGRDCAAYTEVDELYQAYLVGYLVAKTVGLPTNPGNPYTTYANEQPFGTFGGPDVAATLGAVARAAINAVWYQKWLVHLRHRPEAGGGLVHLLKTNQLNAADAAKLGNFETVINSKALQESYSRYGTYLLSQAFAEGSPTHPAYPTGHGTVAGACITVLKFFYDGNAPFTHAVVPSNDGLSLLPYSGSGPLTVNGELHKLAHNISFGHGIHAGIHWRSDTDYSMLLGERVAIEFMLDQMFSYWENFDISITLMDGTTQTFKNS
ncbi:MAG: vanadium-dependent haloperoxidase [Acetobacteraceae bacterium]|nr:vanadium-dependent haloperoxidase [Acetobacteraceae bacterium]